MFDFLADLPQAQGSRAFERSPGVTIDGYYQNLALISRLVNSIKGESISSYTIGIQGRGTLNIPETEFDDLLACMIGMYRERKGLGPIDARFSEVAAADVA